MCIDATHANLPSQTNHSSWPMLTDICPRNLQDPIVVVNYQPKTVTQQGLSNSSDILVAEQWQADS